MVVFYSKKAPLRSLFVVGMMLGAALTAGVKPRKPE
jgi:hypothetical protein